MIYSHPTNEDIEPKKKKKRSEYGGILVGGCIVSLISLYGTSYIFTHLKPNWWSVPTMILAILFLLVSIITTGFAFGEWLKEMEK